MEIRRQTMSKDVLNRLIYIYVDIEHCDGHLMKLTKYSQFLIPYSRLQFTLKIGGNRINFLDLSIINEERKLEFDWFHKSIFSGRYLNYLFSHPISQKRAVIIGMIDRTILLSSLKFHCKNIKINFTVRIYNQIIK